MELCDRKWLRFPDRAGLVGVASLAFSLLLGGCATDAMQIGKSRFGGGMPAQTDNTMPAYAISPNSGNPAFVQADMKQELLQSYGELHEKVLSDYLNGIERRILKQAGAPEDCCRVVLLSDMTLNAHATESGVIYMTMGWIMQAEDEAEVVGLLAHETGHILYGDHSAQHLSDAASIAPQLIAVGEAILAKTTRTTTTLLMARRALYGSAFVQQLVQPTWTRAQERRADRLSVVLTYELGYSVALGTKAMLERIASTSKIEKKEVKQVAKAVQDARPDLQLAQYLDVQTAKLEQELNDQMAALTHDHDDAQQRVDDAVEWYRVVRKDPKFVAGPPQQNDLLALRSRLDVAMLLKRYGYLQSTRADEARGDLKHAFADAQYANLPPLLHAPVAMSERCMVLSMARVPAAKACAMDMLQYAGGSWLPYLDAAHIFREANDPQGGMKLLEIGFDRLGKPDDLYPDLINYAKEVDLAKRNQYYDMCTSLRHAGDIRLRQMCSDARPSRAEQAAASKQSSDQVSAAISKKLKLKK